MKCTRRISKCYLLEEDIGFETSPIKICRSRKLAEHYQRILTPKWEEAFGFGLRVVEMPFYEDTTVDVPVDVVLEDITLEELMEHIREVYRELRLLKIENGRE